MVSSPPSRLTRLQADLVREFFAREQRFVLTGCGALAGFWLGHRDTDDLDLFANPPVPLEDGERALRDAALALSARIEDVRNFAEFKRFRVDRADESCVVDLVIDRAPVLETEKPRFGNVRVDSQREIAANKVSALLGRSEPRDLVDPYLLTRDGRPIAGVLEDAQRKDRGADAATLAWILGSIRIGEEAKLPGGIPARDVEAWRQRLVEELRSLAFREARHDSGA